MICLQLVPLAFANIYIQYCIYPGIKFNDKKKKMETPLILQ